jgi:hypothetical protein
MAIMFDCTVCTLCTYDPHGIYPPPPITIKVAGNASCIGWRRLIKASPGRLTSLESLCLSVCRPLLFLQQSPFKCRILSHRSNFGYTEGDAQNSHSYVFAVMWPLLVLRFLISFPPHLAALNH